MRKIFKIAAARPFYSRFTVIAALVISFCCLQFTTNAFVWIGITWIVFSIYLVGASSGVGMKTLWINLAAAILALTAFESYLWILDANANMVRREVKHEGGSKKYYTEHEYFGYAPPRNKRTRVTKYYEKTLVYDVLYTIDENGLRIAPPYQEAEDSKCIVFFGCSITYGEGVENEETMPYQVGIKTGGKHSIYNFSLSGYGPHQMLSAIEHNIVKDIVDCDKPKIAIFQTGLFHIKRSAGLADWDSSGPRYVLTDNGQVQFTGKFSDQLKKQIERKISSLLKLRKSLIYKKIIEKPYRFRDDHIRLYLNIIGTAKQKFEKMYPGSRFHVLFRDDDDNRYTRAILAAFNEKQIPVHQITKIIPDYVKNKSKYIIDPRCDGHPNAMTHGLIADYLIKHVINRANPARFKNSCDNVYEK